MKKRLSTSIAVACCALAVVPCAADAQPSQAGIEEVVVTARKREEVLQDVPASIAAFTTGDLKDLRIESIEDIGALTPNLMVMESTSGFTSAVACMRAMCRTNTTISEDPMVGTYVDGVYVSKAVGSQFESIDLQRIEVLRGPQGTLYGKNTLGGAINLVSQQPGEEFGGDIELGLGDYGAHQLRGAVNLPLGDTLSARVAGLWKERDGFVDNPVGDDMQQEDKRGARIALRWRPLDRLTIDAAYSYIDQDDVPGGSQPVYFTAPTFDSAGNVTDGLFSLLYGLAGQDLAPYAARNRLDEQAVRGPLYKQLQVDAWTLTAALELGGNSWFDDMSLRSITGYRDQESAFASSLTPYIFSTIGGEVSLDTLQQELQFHFSNRSVDGILGLYYFDESGEEYEQLLFDQVFEQARFYEQDTDSIAAFGELEWHLSEALDLTTGFRYTEEDKSADNLVTFYDDVPHAVPDVLHDPRDRGFGNTVAIDTRNQTYFGLPLSVFGFGPYDTQEDYSSLSPRIGLRYRFDDGIMAFLTWSRGFKSGGFNALSSSPVSWQPYDDVVLDSYEFGLKADLWSGRAQANLTVFYEDVSDMQVQINRINVITSSFEAVVENAGDAEVTGFEFEGVLRPTGSIELSLGVGYQDAEFNEYMALDPVTGAAINVADDRVFEFTPDWSYHVSAMWEFLRTGAGTWRARIDWHGVSEHDFQAVPNPQIDQGDYALLDASVTLEEIPLFGSTAGIALWGKNLTDESYAIGGFSFPDPFGFGQQNFGDPRTWGVELRYRF